MFRLQKLEITGFKSFADYTEIIFTGEGITAIVGPNGCGKSNVSDAITWVLGEQRAKNLRGGDMQDVIFQGSQKRSPSGMAEVVLHLQRTADAPPVNEVADIDAALHRLDERAARLPNTEPTPNPQNPITPENATSLTVSDAPTPDNTRAETSAKRHWRPQRAAVGVAAGEIVSVTRRLYRSGESEYLLNDKSCRLRDIQDLFAGTGLAGTHYAIVEQGRIGQILSAKPMDRRALIEEAAGVSKFRVRQRAAETRLQTARGHLSRISDIVSEVDKQVSSLRRQAAKARRYRLLREELREVLRRVFLAEGRELAAALENLNTQLDSQTTAAQELAENLAAQENAARVATQTARTAEENLAAQRAEAAAAALERDRRARAKDYHLQQIAQLAQRETELTTESTELAARRAVALENAARARIVETELKAEHDTAATRWQAAENAYQQQRQIVTEAEKEVEKARGELLTHTMLAERLAGASRQLEHTLERVAQQAMGLQREGERAAAVHAEHIAEQELLQEEISAAREDLQTLYAQRDTAKQTVNAARAEVQKSNAARAHIRDEASKVKHRLDSLQELARKRAHYAPAVQKLLTEAAQRQQFTLNGTLAEALRVQPAWEYAIETAFGPLLQTVLVPDATDAARVAAWLQQQKTGRAAVLIVAPFVAQLAPESDYRQSAEPFTLTAGNGHSHTPFLANVPPIAQTLTQSNGDHNTNETTSAPPDEQNSYHVSVLLGDVLGVAPMLRQALENAWPQLLKAHLVNDLTEALATTAATGASCVTRSGDYVTGSYVQTGAARDANDKAGLLAFNRELRELRDRAAELAQAVGQAEQATQDARAKSQAAETQLNRIAETISRAEREVMAQDLKARQLAQELERAVRHQRVVADDMTRLMQEQEELQLKRTHAQEEVIQAEYARGAAQEAVNAAQESLRQARLSAENESHSLSKLRTEAATAAERRRAAAAEMRRWEHEERELAARIQRTGQELATLTARAAELRETVADLAERIAQEQTELETEQRDLAASAARLDAARREADALAAEVSALNQRAATLREARAALGVQHAATTERLNHVNENCIVELNQSLAELDAERPTAETGFDLRAGRAKIEELRGKIEGLGAVNMMALEELTTAEERFNFLTAQRQDIMDGIIATDEALKEIKKRSRERFRQAFASINRHFGVLFQELFGGGRGEMSLLDESDVLESGIDLIAQPPGKRLQNVLLLSGGEKAMAALALVLAIFRYRPAPFCLLDEVDAPLDEANVGRFVEKVRQMSEETQFLVVTHNKRTMEAARALYGVTMQEAGVSKLVSVKFA